MSDHKKVKRFLKEAGGGERVVLCRSLEGRLSLLLGVARLSGVSQLDTDSTELLTGVGKQREDR